VHLPPPVIPLFGVAMIASHNLLDPLTAEDVGLPAWLWVILHRPGGATVVGDITFGTGYCLIPWMGVMAAGYGFGTLLLLDRPVRRRWLWALGALVTLGFIVLRGVNIYGDPRPWVEQPSLLWTALSFLNCTKYPASLL